MKSSRSEAMLDLWVVLQHDRRLIVSVRHIYAYDSEIVYVRFGDLRHLRQYSVSDSLSDRMGMEVPGATRSLRSNLRVKFQGVRHDVSYEPRHINKWFSIKGFPPGVGRPITESIKISDARGKYALAVSTDTFGAPITYSSARERLKVHKRA